MYRETFQKKFFRTQWRGFIPQTSLAYATVDDVALNKILFSFETFGVCARKILLEYVQGCESLPLSAVSRDVVSPP